VKHERTPKFYVEYVFKKFKDSAISTYPRKPTDVVVLTDGFCASVCSEFVNNVLDYGEAIVAGVGTPYDDEKKFTASQIDANNVYSLVDIYNNLAVKSEKYGVTTGVTYGEHYPPSKTLNETIPREFFLNKIDVNIPESFEGDPIFDFPFSTNTNFDNIVSKALDVIDSFAESCNPDNGHLLLVTDNCTVAGDNVLKMGYACGSDGHWNKNECKIAVCKPGYVVDFETNECIGTACVSPSPANRALLSGLALVFLFFSLF